MDWPWWWSNIISPVSSAARPANGTSETSFSMQWEDLPSWGCSSWPLWCLSKSARDGGIVILKVWWQTSSGRQSPSSVRGQVTRTGVRKPLLSWAVTGVRATLSLRMDQWEDSAREVWPISLIQPNVWYVLCGRKDVIQDTCSPVVLVSDMKSVIP